MKLYLVERMENIGYDEFDSCVIIAEDEETVHDMLDHSDKYWKNEKLSIDYWDKGRKDRKITEIDLNNETHRVLVSSFNAG